MARRIIVLCALFLAGLTDPGPPARAQTTSNTPTVAAATQDASRVLKTVRPAIIQIKGFFGANTAQAFHGTGFAVAEGGLFITNYHVVAEQVHEPDKYRLEYRTADGKTGKISVLAVDVRNDLAVVRTDDHTPAPLKVIPTIPVKGARAYSVGYALDVGLTITEGVSNGKVEDAFTPRIHYSGAINGGMSGGPALNANGDVIGVNVSGYLFSQLVSFLVPAAPAALLRDHAIKVTGEAAPLKDTITEQVKGHAVDLLAALDGPVTTQASSGYVLPAKMAPFIDCSASVVPAQDQPVQLTRIECSAKAGIHLQQGFTSGNLHYLHKILTTEKLDAWRFAHKLSLLTNADGRFGQRKHVGPFACKNKIVALKGFDASLVVCARAYRDFAGIHDFVVRVSSLNGTAQGFTSHLDLFGVEFEGGTTFIQSFVEAMEWKP
ncbi:MAG: serine protease [Hyphomicrobiales bacterium]|nr:serine protease [Hyphomicrobiales bacterium]